MTETVDEMASRWIARLDHEDASAEDRRAFEAWLAVDARHAEAYARHEAVWKRLLNMRRAQPESIGAVTGEAPRPARQRSAMPWLRTHSRSIAAGWSVALIAALALWLSQHGAGAAQDLETEVGGYRRVVLTDDSIVELNTDTELRVSIDAVGRRVELLKGEAIFRVAKDPNRPFTVVAGDTTVQALGTVFNVRRRPNAVEILMVDGEVALASLDAGRRPASGDPRTLPVIHAGQAAVAAETGIAVRAVSRAEVERGLAWQQGMLSFDAATLDEAAAEFNRYNTRRLVVDPAIANLRIGGYFRARNIDGFVRVIESEFGVEAVHERGEIRLMRANRS
jgi:transmembrane sensor